jgi:hypothetical protein
MAYSLSPSMKELAEGINAQVNTIITVLDSQSFPHPSFRADAPSALPEDAQVQAARTALIETANDLILLAQGPSEYVRNETFVVCIIPTAFSADANTMPRDGTTSPSSESLTIMTSGMPSPLKARSLTTTYPRKSAFPPVTFTASSGTQ